MSKFSRLFIFSFLFLTITVAGFAGYLAFQFLQTPAGAEQKEIIYEVRPQKSFNSVALELQNLGLIKNAQIFSWYARLTGQRSKMKVGEYRFETKMRPQDVLAILTSGKSIEKPFTIPEGLNIYEIAEEYEKNGFGKQKDFLNLCKDKEFIFSVLGERLDSLEGYLYPETYQITKFTDTKSLLQAMTRRFFLVYKELESIPTESTLTRHQKVTLASIVEKETGAPQERPTIASVFYNRLKLGMRLQTDPTIIYGIAEMTGLIPNNIQKEDILKPTAYNTYVIAGLPPGPIANPGKQALLSVFKPAETKFLYFVSRNDGTHVFSETYAQHSGAVQKFQLDRRAREGKSWRDLNKTN